jgi:hypothetical protein
VTLVSRASGAAGAKGDFESRNPAISADGRYVAFGSGADWSATSRARPATSASRF